MVRLGFITGEYPPMRGGIADYTQLLAQELAAQGAQVHILTEPRAMGEHKTPSPQPLSTPNPLPASPILGGGGIELDPLIKDWNRAFFGAIRAWAARHRLQIVHLQYQTAAFRMAGLLHLYPRLFSNPSGPRFVTTFHDLRFPYLFPKAGDRLRQALVWELGRHSAGVVTTNGADAARLAAALGPAVPLAQIPLGATVRLGPPPDEGALAALRARLGLGAGEFVTGHFGFLNRSKGADILFQAAAQARAAGIPLRLLMLGERLGDSDPTNLAYAEGLDRLAAHLKLDPLWTGPLRDEELGAYFALCDVVALPFLDGASLRRTSLQAALLAGRPVISTWPAAEDLAALPEGEGLFYVGRGELGELAGALGRLYGDEGERSKLGAGARRLAARFDWGEIAGQHLGFYERLK